MATTPEPVSYPAITLAGQEYKIRFSWGTIRRMRDLKIDLHQIVADAEARKMARQKAAAESGQPETDAGFEIPIDDCCKIISAIISSAKQPVTFEEVADMIDVKDAAEIMDKILEGFRKAAGVLAPSR